MLYVLHNIICTYHNVRVILEDLPPPIKGCGQKIQVKERGKIYTGQLVGVGGEQRRDSVEVKFNLRIISIDAIYHRQPSIYSHGQSPAKS